MFRNITHVRTLKYIHALPKRTATLTNTRTFRHSIILREPDQNHTEMPKFPSPVIIDENSQTTGTAEPAEIQQRKKSENIYLDTMKIFNELKTLGFTDTQSDVILRLIRQNMTANLDKLQSRMLTEEELENELYLFEAAQSELRVETKNSRELDLKTLQIEKANLEILLNEEIDELNEFLIMKKNDSQVRINDQKSENTLLQKKIKAMIQDLDNKISTGINSEIKSEVESLRWHTTRSGLTAVLVLVFSVMGGVSISKRINKEEQPTEVILRTLEPEDHNLDDEEHENSQQLDLNLKEKHE